MMNGRTTTPGKTLPAVRGLPTRPRFAAVVDLENVAITRGVRVSPAELDMLLTAIKTNVEGMPARVATGLGVLRPYMQVVSELPWGLTVVGSAPDAADDALYAIACEFIRQGATDIVVVSGDHKFVALAARARIHVLSHASHLSRELSIAATTVTHLPETSRPTMAA